MWAAMVVVFEDTPRWLIIPGAILSISVLAAVATWYIRREVQR